MGESGADQPSDTMRERAGENRAKLWLLLEADRWVITGLLVASVFGILVLLGRGDPSPLRAAMENGDPIETAFQGFLTAIITGVTLVVTLTQLVISQELGAVGDQEERMEAAMDFRDSVEEAVDASVAPAAPAAFLQAIIEETAATAARLRDATGDLSDEQLRDGVDDLVGTIHGNAEAVSDQLEAAQFGTFDVLFAALNYNYSWKIYEARRLRQRADDELPEPAREAFDDLIEVLRVFGPAREHFKTLYFQWELVNLSRVILYAAVPALVISIVMILYVGTPGAVPGVTLGVENLVWVVSAAVALATVPFMLLLAYVLRIVTVAKRTLAIGPFLLRRSQPTDEDDAGR